TRRPSPSPPSTTSGRGSRSPGRTSAWPVARVTAPKPPPAGRPSSASNPSAPTAPTATEGSRLRTSGSGLRIWRRRAAALLVVGLCASATAMPADSLVYLDLLPARTSALLDPPRTTPRKPGASHPHGDIAFPCEACHTPNAWTPLHDPLLFDHSEETRFVMTGKHEQLACASCHLDLRFDQPNFTADECASCHLDVHRGQLGDACQDCHNTQNFHLLNGQLIHAQTAFPLTGAHLQITCESCHA